MKQREKKVKIKKISKKRNGFSFNWKEKTPVGHLFILMTDGSFFDDQLNP